MFSVAVQPISDTVLPRFCDVQLRHAIRALECRESIQCFYCLHAFFCSERAAVHTQVVIIRLAPFGAGINLIICLAFFIFIFNSLHGFFIALSVNRYYPFGSFFSRRMNKDGETVCDIFQDEIGTPAYNDAWSFFCQIRNNFLLSKPQFI